jgi:hypothetical protein
MSRIPAGLRQPLRPVVLVLVLAGVGAATASGELIQQGNLQISFDGQITPKRLPRHGMAPVSVAMSAEIGTTDGSKPPQLQYITLEINRHGRLTPQGLPSCRRGQLAFATTHQALRRCRDALVGRGHVSAKIALPEQAPLPSEGELLAFNGHLHGHPVIYGHVYGATPLPITLVVPFAVARTGGRFGTRLQAAMPQVAADWGYVTDFRMTLGRRYRAGGKRRSYLNAGCPAPKGFPGALFTLARGTYSFGDGRQLQSSLVRNCMVRRGG